MEDKQREHVPGKEKICGLLSTKHRAGSQMLMARDMHLQEDAQFAEAGLLRRLQYTDLYHLHLLLLLILYIRNVSIPSDYVDEAQKRL